MGTWIQKYAKNNSALSLWLYGALFFYLLETALPDVWLLSPAQICLLGAGWQCWKNREPLWSWRPFREKEYRAIFRWMAVYILLWGVSFFYTRQGADFFHPWVTVIQMAGLLFLCGYQAQNDGAFSKRIFWAPLFSAVTAVLLAVILYIAKQTPYQLRISPIRDYNQYAMVLLFGEIVLWVRSPFARKAGKGVWTEGLTASLLLTGIWLSGSRRGMILAAVVFLWHVAWDGYHCFRLAKSRVRRRWIRRLFLENLLIFAAVFCFVLALTAAMPRERGEVLSENGQRENTLLGTAETIQTGEAMGKRGEIWWAAFHAYLDFSPVEKWWGRGNSYPYDLYEQAWGDRVRKSYGMMELPYGALNPHNFLLTELLSGGILRLTAAIGWWLCLLRHSWRRKGGRSFRILLWLVTVGTLFLSAPVGFAGSRLFWTAWLLTDMDVRRKKMAEKVDTGSPSMV